MPGDRAPAAFTAARDLVLTTTGLSSAELEKCTQWAGALGVRFMGELTDQCTHLIATTVLTPKYRMAIERHIAVVGLEWLEESFKGGELLPERPHLLRPLHDLVICLSGATFDVASRARIEALRP